jgi:serine/threonine-protein kinase
MVVGVGRLVSSDSIPVGGLTPGAILADRYRIIGLLGRGGMGEVYRADDVKLGQPVALKFLPRGLSSDPVRRERFFAEVRIARQLAHPNICRVYDIGEVRDQYFLSMEFIDGEDLASLIKRIGHLSNEKGLDVARQLAAGLAAAHERGVLHRDLKPANIMIDGHGRVRITDFGLAIATTDEAQQQGEVAGTPAYMAPEQLAGKGASVRSDIYSLGLVLYELFSGRRAFAANTLAQLREQKEQSTPSAPSESRAGVDPIVEQLIMRCLERDPRARPASVAQVAAALPGGDPLAAAIAAGETPSPELVAASGLREGLQPVVAVALLAFVIVGSLAAVAINRRTMLIERLPAGKPPAFLVERAKEIVRKAGYVGEPADVAFGLDYDVDPIRYVETTNKSADRWKDYQSLSPVTFWYRQSPQPLERNPSLYWSIVTSVDPPYQFAGEVLVRLDGQGQLMRLEAIPPQTREPVASASPLDWSNLLAESGVGSLKWTPSEPQSNPATFADSVKAWTSTLPAVANAPLHVEAAAYRDRPVSFRIIGPWTRDDRSDFAPARQIFRRNIAPVATFVSIIVALVCMVGGVLFARRNLRLGRGDRRGAGRLMIVVAAINMVVWVFSEHHVPTAWEFILFVTALSAAVFFASLVGVAYIAFEPFVRRRWPQVLVSWSRVVLGSWRDPLVGRDLLMGCAAGVALSCLSRFEISLPAWFGYPEPSLATPPIFVSGPAVFVSALLQAVFLSMFVTLVMLFLLFFLRVVLRNEWAAVVAWVAVVTVLSLSPVPGNRLAGESVGIVLPIFAIENVLQVVVLRRLGLVAFAIAAIVENLFVQTPMTFQTSAWYAGYGYVALALVAVIALYGARTSLAGQPIFGATAFQD